MVFCKKCKHFNTWEHDFGSQSECHHPAQKSVVRHTYYASAFTVTRWGEPGELNKNNDCCLYEPNRMTRFAAWFKKITKGE